MRQGILFVALIAIVACTKPTNLAAPDQPELVEVAMVKASVLTTSPQETATCESEIRASGAEILYRGAQGLLLIDRRAEELRLAQCQATVENNREIELRARASGDDPKPDLATLLRLLPAEEIGARSFVAANPQADGRGVLIGILDTGVEVDHPMLRRTTTGAIKVVDFQDTSGEGRVSLASVALDAEGKFTAPGGAAYSTGFSATEARFGIFPGSTLRYSEDVAEKDTFKDLGVLTYKNAGGERRARVDRNDDKNFADEVELADYAAAPAFIKLGEKQTLTTSLKISADGSIVNLCFDDGTHGTHVAGIAAGYDSQGISGVAPGAQVVAVKIGDNRLSGGSTTTASMLLAIDYAVEKGVRIINLSYGIRSGSNLGKSAIDAYVDKVAKERDVLFSISAGNEGPALLTTGTPAGANLAITNGAYISKETARENYGYLAVEDDNVWYFSSVGPRLDGGLKPTLLAPGSALSAVPPWAGGHQNYRGTSMASPQTTGGLALILSAATQGALPSDRARVTQAVYQSAKAIASLAVVEQGHGLMSVPGAVESLKKLKTEIPVEYGVGVNSPTSPEGKGAGIYVRSRNLPANLFNVTVTPSFGEGVTEEEKLRVRTMRLVPSHEWIKVPAPGTLWIHSAPRVIQVGLDATIMIRPGLHSGKISAVDEQTGRVAFVIPVTVVAPTRLDDSSAHKIEIATNIRVGQTLRYFLDVPAGTTSLTVDLSSDGPFVWGQLLDPEGRRVAEIRDVEGTAPMVPVSIAARITRPGVYELDLVQPANSQRHAAIRAKVQAYSFTPSPLVAGPGDAFTIELQNNFESLKLLPRVEVRSRQSRRVVEVTGDRVEIPFTITDEDVASYSAMKFTVSTAKSIYDLMTDYPFRVFDKDQKLVASGGLELVSEIEIAALDKLARGAFTLEVQGAFTKEAPPRWAFELREDRLFPVPRVLFSGNRILVESGQSFNVPLTFPEGCVTLVLTLPGGQVIQESPVCR